MPILMRVEIRLSPPAEELSILADSLLATTLLRMLNGLIKPDKGKVTVLVSIFGRATPVELDFTQVEKG